MTQSTDPFRSVARPELAAQASLPEALLDRGEVTAEDRLLLLAARPQEPSSDLPRAETVVRAVIDWDYVVDAAVRHSVAPLLHNLLADLSAPLLSSVPRRTRDELAGLTETSRSRAERLFDVVRTVADAFAHAGVPVLALKDIQLAAVVYGDPASRPMGDLDLLIHRQDYERAANLLAALGFEPHPLPKHRYTLRYGMGHHLRRASDDVWIDLQWNVAQREWDVYGEGTFTYDPAGMWERSAPISAQGLAIAAPSLEDMLFHLCLHLEGHAYAELILFSDIAFLLRAAGEALDWDALVALARSYRAESSIYDPLLLTALLLGVGPPTDVFRRLEPRYSSAGAFPAIFGTLGALHESLDEIDVVADPRPALARRLEAVVRRHTAEALLAYRELDALASDFFAAKGTAWALDSSPSPRRFPEDRLEAFGVVDAFISARELDALILALDAGGWNRADGSTRWGKRVEQRSKDPLVDQVGVDLELEIGSDVGRALESAAGSRSKAQALLVGLHRRRRSVRAQGLTIRMHALPPAELVTTLAARLVVHPRLLLSRLAGAWLVFQRLGGDVSGASISEVDRGLAGESERHAGLALASWALRTPAPPPTTSPGARFPRLFGSARDVTTERPLRAAMKAVYLYMLPLLHERDARARFAYIRTSLRSGDGGGAVLWRLVRDLAAGAIAQLRHPPRPRRSYWADREPSDGGSESA